MIGSCRSTRKRALLLVGAVALAMPLLESRLRADNAYEFIKIADTSTTIPGAGGTFTSFSSPEISGYNVAFIGTKAGYTGIFNSSNGTLGLTVDTTTLIPNTATPFSSFSGFSLDNSDLNPSNAALAFTGSGSGMQGIYLSNANGLSKIVNLNTTIPNGTGSFTALSAPSLSNGNIAFVGSGAGQQGVYSNTSGSLQVVANVNTTIPSGTGTFTVGSFASASLSNSDVSFVAGGASGQQGVYTTTFGSLHNVANLNTPLPGGTSGNFSGFTNVSTVYGTNSFGDGANPSALHGVYSEYQGTLSLVANTSTAIPSGNGNFTSFATPTNLGGDTVFVGSGSGGQSGLYTNQYPGMQAIINNSSSLGGKVISSVSTAGSPQAIGNANGDEFTFVANFSDASSTVYVAEENYNWSSGTSGAWDSSANWSFGLKPRTVLYTNLQPNYGAVVTGPSTATSILGLNINTNYQQGIADLVLQPSGPLSVTQNISINYTGEVDINGGSLISNGGIYVYGGYLRLGGGMVSGGDLNIQYDYNGRPGTVDASGNIGSHVENNALLEVFNTSAHFTNTINNYHEFDILNGQMQIDEDVFNWNGGNFNVRNSIVQFGTQLDNMGQFNVSFGTADIFGNFNNDTGGQVILSGNSNTTFYDNVTNNGMTFRVSAGSTAVFFGAVSGTGSFTGTGTKFFEGTLTPGPALIALAGPATFDASNTLQVALGGPAAGAGYGQVNVAGQLSLDGTLQVTLANGYVPAVGSTYNVLNWSSVTGNFATVPTTTQQGILKMFWNTSQTPTGVNVTLTRAYYDIQGGKYTQALIGSGVGIVKTTTGTATLTNYQATGPIEVSAGTLSFALTTEARGTPSVMLQMSGLTVSTTSVLDLTNHDAIITGATFSQINAWIGNALLGNPGPAIIASNSQVYGGSGDNAIPVPLSPALLAADGITSWDGVNIPAGATLVVYALVGDAALEGIVNGDAYAQVTSNFGATTPGYADIGTSWTMGDVALEGIVNGDDYAAITSAFGQSPQFASSSLIPATSGGAVSTPEPASLALLGLGALGMLFRRRSSRR